MQINIKPQDKSTPEKLELELHPSLIKRLREYASSLDNSEVSYVASQIFEQVLPVEKAPKKAKPEPVEQAASRARKGPPLMSNLWDRMRSVVTKERKPELERAPKQDLAQILTDKFQGLDQAIDAERKQSLARDPAHASTINLYYHSLRSGYMEILAAVQRASEREELTERVTATMQLLRESVRQDWPQELATHFDQEHEISARYEGTTDAYNRMVDVVTDLHEAGTMSLSARPEPLSWHAEVRSARDQAAAIEFSSRTKLRQQPAQSESAAQLFTGKLTQMANDIRAQWTEHALAQPDQVEGINAEFRGQISAYNDMVASIYDLAESGKLDLAVLPEILHPEEVETGVWKEANAARQDHAYDESISRNIGPQEGFSPVEFGDQEQTIREEWQRDLALGTQNAHDLETYFAGRIDQHNTLIEMAVEARPEVQQTLPPQINYEQLRAEVSQQTIAQVAEQKQAPAYAMGMEI